MLAGCFVIMLSLWSFTVNYIEKSDHLFSSEQQLRHPLNFSGPTMHQAVLHSVRTDHHGKPKYRPPLEMSAIHQNNITKGSRRKTEQSQAAERNSSRIKLPPMSVDLPSVETNTETLDISKALDKMKYVYVRVIPSILGQPLHVLMSYVHLFFQSTERSGRLEKEGQNDANEAAA